jgi:cytosine/adenosine deaminase-related metal-dependent hydrolase
MIHYDKNISNLSRELLESVTRLSATALNIKSGIIQEGYLSDFVVIKLPQEVSNNIALDVILHTKEVSKSFINGKEIF